jgi:MFS family permease
MQFPKGLRAFNHRDYRMYFTGQLISQVGTWMQSIAQSWLIVTLTGSAFKLGLISTLQFLPTLLFALYAGALADRLPKRKTLLATQTAMMLLAFVLSALVYSGHVQYWHVAIMALLLGFTRTLDMPVRQAFVVEMVGGRDDLSNAIALNSALVNGARLIGPAVAGLLIARYGVALAFLINGVSFLAVLAALMNTRAEGLPKPRAPKPIWGDIMDGLRYTYRTPVVFFLLALLLVIGLFVINFQVLVTEMASGVLHLGAEGFGYLMSSLGAGALVGAMVLAFRGKGPAANAQGTAILAPRGFAAQQQNLNPLILSGLLLCTVTTLMYFVHLFWLACVGVFLMGLSQIMYTADTNTSLQVLVPDELRGRVISLYQLMFTGTTPVGSLVTGAVMEHYSPSAGFLVDGGMGLMLALALVFWWRRSQRTSLSSRQSMAD